LRAAEPFALLAISRLRSGKIGDPCNDLDANLREPTGPATLKDALIYLQNAGAIAFVLLGVATAVGWARRKDRSLGFLALAIVLLSLVSLLGRIPPSYAPPLIPQISLIAFMGSGYALLRFRGSLIPLPRLWHAIAVIAIVVATGGFLAAQGLVAVNAAPIRLQTAAVIVLLVVWTATIIEPIVRFWLVARHVPAVQAWRLRSLSFGFGGLVAILVFAVGAGAFASNLVVQFLIQLAVLFIVPLLYVSFSPPSWLRRQWRSSEEEGLRAFMQDQLLGEDPVALADRALEWAMRLVGGAAAVAIDGKGERLAARGLDSRQLSDLEQRVPELSEGVSRFAIDGVVRTMFVLPISGAGPEGHLVVLAGPFTPSFGGDELSRVQQFMTAVATAVDRARLLERLKGANADLLDANRHKTLFLANMSHELRTPLNAILGFSELLIDATSDQFPDETRKRFLEQIHSSGKHLLGLINDILDLSKIEAGQMELRLQMVSVAGVVGEVASSVEPLAAQKQIHLEFEAASAGQILADESKLKQMILNLISNAIKFTADGGTVTIKAARVADRLQIIVSDNGIGIAQQDIDHLFKEFQQVDSGVNRKQQGTGLGLALTRSFAILHGGDVHVQSELGKGSQFTIDLPVEARRPIRIPNDPDSGENEAGDSIRPLVIVVEDDPAAAELLSRQIGRAGFRAEIARTGAEALSMAKERKPAAITLDILLPDVDGWEVLTRLKRDEATSAIPVIVVSVVDNPDLGTALGALDYFVKPVDAKDLVNRLNNFNFKHKAGGRPASVLVVDDEAANREWLKLVLEPAGFKVILATGGSEAIDLARSLKPDVVMLDLLMPEVNGFDVVAALSEHEATRSIPIMVLTAKHLTESDIDQLNRHVSTIIRRGSTGAVDLIDQLQIVLNKGPVAV
jgi:signal transduction histidine kinase/DNA-binding response OmpR family regulator